MFYIKSGHSNVPIKDPIYTTCPRCGGEHQVDLQDLLADGGDLYGTQVYCCHCTAERARRHPTEPWAEMVLREDY